MCKDGFVRHFGNTCMTCPRGSHLNPPAYRCDCDSLAYEWNSDGTKCVPKY